MAIGIIIDLEKGRESVSLHVLTITNQQTTIERRSSGAYLLHVWAWIADFMLLIKLRNSAFLIDTGSDVLYFPNYF